jgi:thermitase
LLVKFSPGLSSHGRANAIKAVRGRELSTIPSINVRVISVTASGAASGLARLKKMPGVEFAEPNSVRKPQELLPSDPSFPKQYAVGGGAWGWYTTNTTRAWDITQGSSSVVIAIIDTGLKTQGLADYSGQTVSGWNVLNNSSDTSSTAGNHGTYVAGVAGLASNNGVGNSGFCPACKIMPIQVGTDSGASDSAIAAGIVWAADHGARVANLSWAGSGDSQAIQDAVNYAHSKGLVITAAAGNSNCDCKQYPAADQNVLGVAGTTSTDTKQGDSNFGSWVTIAAPEGNMTSWPTINGAPGYAPVGGTSLAAPVVAGIAGLLFSANPGLTNTQVEQALTQTATPVGFPVATGRVDALAALNYVGFSNPQPSSVPVNTTAPQIYVETNGDWNYTALAGSSPQPGQILLRGQGSWTGSAPLSLSGVSWLRCDNAGANCTTVGTTAKYTVQPTDAGFTLKLSVTVKNALGQTTLTSALSQPVGGSAPPPPPPPASPANTTLPTVSGSAQDGQTLSASTGTWSGSPSSYGYQWQRCDSSGAGCSSVAGATAASYAVTSADVGATMRVTVTATNSAGSASATSAATAVVAPAPPPAPPSAPATQTLTFSGSLNPKNPARSFLVAVGAGVAEARLSFSKCPSLSLALQGNAASPLAAQSGPSVIVLDAVLPAGTYTYVVSGGRCSFTLTVTSPTP